MAATLDSKTKVAERKMILDDLNSKTPNLKLLYITPEMFKQDSFKVFTFVI